MLAIPLLLMATLSGAAADRWESERERMVRQQIESRGVRHPGVLKAMRTTPRHLFVPEPVRTQAYADGPLPIGYGQTISQPYIVASMTELLDPKPSHRVLEIGTGSGYQAAILSPLVKEVYTIEIIPELAASAEALLKKLGYQNIFVRVGDGYLGWPEKAPFDRIILTAAPPQIPQSLIDQLANGGKMVAPAGAGVWEQELYVVDKDKNGKVTRRSVYGVRFVPMVKGKKED
jgi:protein-L-isoaspartate(D-aspartate) O-methyltransferase